MERFTSNEYSILDIHYINSNYKQDFIGKHFHKRKYTDHIYHD